MRLKLMIFSLVCGLALVLPWRAQAQAERPVEEVDGSLSVVVSIHPLQMLIADLTHNVVPVKLTTLMPMNASPHDFSLSPQQMRQLRDADWVLWLGAKAEPYLAGAVRQHARRDIALLALDGVIVRHSGEEGAHGDAYRDNHDQDHDHDHDHHTHDSLDPHLWWQLDNLLLMAAYWVSHVAEQQPEWAGVLNRRLDEWRVRLEAQRAEMRASMTQREVRALSYHDAFGYLFDDLGLVAPSAVMPSPNTKPGVRQVMQLRKDILEQRSRCFLIEPAAQPQWLSLIDPEVTLARVVIDPLGWDVPEASHARVSTLFGQAYRKLKSCVYPPFTSE